jgi:hypothetical protein
MMDTLLPLARRAFLLIAVLCLVTATGCGNSAYHRAGKVMTGDLHDRLALRIYEARLAGVNAAQTLKTTAEPSALCAEKADLAAWDFSRRVLSIKDVLARIPEPDQDSQRVLAELEKADLALAAAMEHAGPDRLDAWAQAAATLDIALASADTYLAASDPAYAGMLKAD